MSTLCVTYKISQLRCCFYAIEKLDFEIATKVHSMTSYLQIGNIQICNALALKLKIIIMIDL